MILKKSKKYGLSPKASIRQGFMLINVMLAGTLLIFLAGGLISVALFRQRLYTQQAAIQESLHVTESGVNYYRWHLAHSHIDYYDGTGSDPGDPGEPYGPYDHSFSSHDGTITGKYQLEITPPSPGSSVVSIKSTGWVDDYPQIKRVVIARYGIPSLASYTLLANLDLKIRPSDSVSGLVRSNGGIRMDGSNDSLTTSARASYTCLSSHGCDSSNCSAPCAWTAGTGCICPGVWGAGSGSSLWRFPATAIDFEGITIDLAGIKAGANASGVYLPDAGGGKDGYHLVFLSNGTFNVYTISRLQSGVSQGNDDWNGYASKAEEIRTESFTANYALPANGLIFIEDDAWIEGVITGRLTIAAAVLPDNPTQRKSIVINGNLSYSAYDGSVILGLIAQKDIKVPKFAPDPLTLNGILFAQYGRVMRNYYASPMISANLNFYGSAISNKEPEWNHVNGSGVVTDGYSTVNWSPDPFASDTPPPSFPTTGEYVFISWEEEAD